MVVAASMSLLCALGVGLWITPTSLEYLELTDHVRKIGDLNHELFLLRPPGYPLMLAGCIALFGTGSGIALLAIQHAMTIATAAFVSATGWHLTRRRDVMLMAGLSCATSLQVLSYANQVMVETPYLFAVTMTVYFLLRSLRSESAHDLAYASASAGLAYLFRPIGITLPVFCVFVAAYVAGYPKRNRRRADWTFPPLNAGTRVGGRRGVRLVVAAAVPAGMMVGAWFVQNQMAYGASSFTRCLDFALYNRFVYVERATAKGNAALSEILSVVDEAKRLGRMETSADEGLAWTVWKAYEGTRGSTLNESSAVLGRAALDALDDDPRGVALQTLRYAAWMLLTPDSSYRYVPGGSPGEHGRRDPTAEVFDSAMYAKVHAPVIANLWPEFHARSTPTALSAPWASAARVFYRQVERAGPRIGPIGSWYELGVVVCVLGGAWSVCSTRRAGWLVVGGVIAMQILPSAFLAGVGPRYAVPVQPLLQLCGALILCDAARGFCWSLRAACTIGRAARLGCGGAPARG